MDRDLLILNIGKFCEQRGEKVTNACKAAGVGTSFVPDIRRGQTPSVAKVADLAHYLGVTTSDLVGDAAAQLPELPPDLQQLSDALDELNAEGRERLLEYADDLVQSGKYKKADTPRMDKKA